MTAASQRASRAVTRERQIQINYIPLICDFFSVDGLILFVKLYATTPCCFFYHQDAVFERNLFHNGHNNNSPEEMKCKQRNMHLYYNVIVSLD